MKSGKERSQAAELKREIEIELNLFKRREERLVEEKQWQALLERRPDFLKEEEALLPEQSEVEQSIADTQMRLYRQIRRIEDTTTQLLTPNRRNLLADLDTREQAAINQQFPPIRRPQITEGIMPIRRIEYHLERETLSNMMQAATLLYASKYDSVPSEILMSYGNYVHVLPLLRCQAAYKDGFQMDTEGRIIVPYGVDKSLDNYSVACVESKRTRKL